MNNTYVKQRDRSTISDYAYIIFSFFCFFPFLFPLPGISMDMQPYAMIFSALLLLICFNKVIKIKLTKELTAFALLLIAAVILGAISLTEVSFINVLRGLATYITVFVVALAVFLFDDVTIDKEKLFKFYILIWFFVGIIQMFINRRFMMFIVSGARVSMKGYRGCNSLASEPSFFGVQCFYFLYVAKSFKKHRTFYYVLIAVMSVAMAQSLAAMIFVCPFYLQELVEAKAGLKKIIMFLSVIAATVITVYVLLNFFPDIRLSKLLETVFNESISALDDKSAEVRLSTIIGSFTKSFENYLIPIGFTKRLGSAWGCIICELGFLAIPYIAIIPFTLARIYTNPIARVVCFIAITVVYINNVQLSNPMLAFIIGNILYDFNKENLKVGNKKFIEKGQKADMGFNS